MNKEKQTDRIIRNKLKYHTSASPDHLWDAIDAQLPVDKKRRGGFWWWTGSLLGGLLLIGGVTFLLLSSELTTNEASESDATFSSVKEPALEKELKPTIAPVLNEELATTTIKDQTLVAITEYPAIPSASKITKEFTPIQITSEKITSSSPIGFAMKQGSVDLPNEANVITTPPANTTSDQSFSKQNESAAAAISISTIGHFAALEQPSTSILLKAKTETLDWPSMLKDPKCATFGKWLKLHFYGDIYFSPDIAFRELESKNSEYDTYAANRKATETQLFSYSTGARFSVVSNYGLALRTGIVYSQINERFKYESESETRTIVKDVFDDDGNLIRTDTIIETGSRFKTTHNQYRMIDVPILLGYEVNFKKVTLALNGGIYANLSSKQKGDFLSPIDLRPVTFTSDAEGRHPAFRERLDFSVYGSVACMYNLNERWQFMLEPQFRYFMDPMTLPDYMVEQKYITAGVITGLRYRF